jgi:RNA polymerase sigma-70 factor (sigma-E family)
MVTDVLAPPRTVRAGTAAGPAVSSAPDGDRSFTAFAREAAPRLCRTAYLLCRDWHQAQDLAQITLAKMFLSWRRVRRSANLAAYSRRVLVHALVDQKRLRRETEVVCAELPADGRTCDAGTPELRLTLLDALGTLPARDRTIVVLRYCDDLSVETVAGMLGVTPTVVKTQSFRALGRLRLLLGDTFPVT